MSGIPYGRRPVSSSILYKELTDADIPQLIDLDRSEKVDRVFRNAQWSTYSP